MKKHCKTIIKPKFHFRAEALVINRMVKEILKRENIFRNISICPLNTDELTDLKVIVK